MCGQAVAQMTATNVQLTDVNGEKHRLSEFKGKYIYFISQRGNAEGIANIWRMNFIY